MLSSSAIWRISSFQIEPLHMLCACHDLQSQRGGLWEPQVAFLFTDSHVAEEGFLELLNTMLTTGMPTALFEDAERDALVAGIRDEACHYSSYCSCMDETLYEDVPQISAASQWGASSPIWPHMFEKVEGSLQTICLLAGRKARGAYHCRGLLGGVQAALP